MGYSVQSVVPNGRRTRWARLGVRVAFGGFLRPLQMIASWSGLQGGEGGERMARRVYRWRGEKFSCILVFRFCSGRLEFLYLHKISLGEAFSTPMPVRSHMDQANYDGNIACYNC